MSRAIITGGTTGIGLATIRGLIERDFESILFTARTAEKGDRTVAELQELLAAHPATSLAYGLLDLGRISSVKAFVASLPQEKFTHVILNAGVMSCPYGLTEDGFETQTGVNHFGHAYLFHSLEMKDLVVSTARVVIVASGAHFSDPGLDKVIDDWEAFNWEPAKREYNAWAAYGQSKLCNVLYGRALQVHRPEMTVATLHPGVVRTELSRHMGGISGVCETFGMTEDSFLTPAQGAATSLAAVDMPASEFVGGQYWQKSAPAEDACSGLGKDMALAEKLWVLTEQWSAKLDQ